VKVLKAIEEKSIRRVEDPREGLQRPDRAATTATGGHCEGHSAGSLLPHQGAHTGVRRSDRAIHITLLRGTS